MSFTGHGHATGSLRLGEGPSPPREAGRPSRRRLSPRPGRPVRCIVLGPCEGPVQAALAP